MSELDSALTRILEGHPELLSAWLFGSTLTRRTRPDSDVDVAVLFDRSPGWKEAAELQVDLTRAVGHDRVDLVVLNTANCILRFEAVSGRNLLCRDPEEQAGFVSLTSREYEEEIARLDPDSFRPR